MGGNTQLSPRIWLGQMWYYSHYDNGFLYGNISAFSVELTFGVKDLYKNGLDRKTCSLSLLLARR